MPQGSPFLPFWGLAIRAVRTCPSALLSLPARSLRAPRGRQRRDRAFPSATNDTRQDGRLWPPSLLPTLPPPPRPLPPPPPKKGGRRVSRFQLLNELLGIGKERRYPRMARSTCGGCRSLRGAFASVVPLAGFALQPRPPAQRAMSLRSLTASVAVARDSGPPVPTQPGPRQRLPAASSPRFLRSSRAGAPRYLGCLQQVDCWSRRGAQILLPEPFL